MLESVPSLSPRSQAAGMVGGKAPGSVPGSRWGSVNPAVQSCTLMAMAATAGGIKVALRRAGKGEPIHGQKRHRPSCMRSPDPLCDHPRPQLPWVVR